MSERSKRLTSMAESAWTDKNNLFQTRHEDAARMVFPDRTRRGTKDFDSADSIIHDSTAPQASQNLANKFLIGMTPPWSPWGLMEMGDRLKIAIPKEQHSAVKSALASASKILSNEINNSNFVNAIYSAFLDFQINFGGLKVEPTLDNLGVRYTNVPSDSAAITADADGYITSSFVKEMYSGSELIEQFGPNAVIAENRNKLTGEALKKASDNPLDTTEFHTIVVPNFESSVRNYLYVMVSVDTNKSMLLIDTEINDTPYVWIRYSPVANTAYGRGPVVTQKYDIRFLNKIKDVSMTGAIWDTTPTFLVDDDETMNPYTMGKLEPGMNIPAGMDPNGNDTIRQLGVVSKFDISRFSIEMYRKDIRNGFHDNQFGDRPDAKTPISPTEILERSRDLNNSVAPTAAMVEREGLLPIYRKTANIMRSQNRFPSEFVIEKGFIDVAFLSAMARDRREAEVAKLFQFAQIAGQMGSTEPGSQLVANIPEILRTIADLQQLPSDSIRSRDEIAAIQQSIAEQAEQAGQGEIDAEQQQNAG